MLELFSFRRRMKGELPTYLRFIVLSKKVDEVVNNLYSIFLTKQLKCKIKGSITGWLRNRKFF